MAQLQEYKCLACGGALEFNSGIQKMKCPFCDTEYEMETLAALDEELKKELPEDMTWETGQGREWEEDELKGMVVYGCKSCGGEIIGEETTAATSCPFCDNPVVIMGQFQGELRPDYVIPFKLDKERAVKSFEKHLMGKRLLPKVFKDENHIEEIKGIYVPFWLFDSDADASIRYRATRITSWNDKNYNYTRTSFYNVIREGDIGFEKIPVDGSSNMDDDLMESIEPFDFKDAVDFQTAYLAGYLADKYDVGEEDSVKRANARIKRSTEDSFRSTVRGYATVTPEHTSIRLKNGRAKYALYPVWILNTDWKGEKYVFAMNGQTGKFVGNLPMDRSAYLKYFGIFTLVFSVLSYIIIRLVR